MHVHDLDRFRRAFSQLRGALSYYQVSSQVSFRTHYQLDIEPSTYQRWQTGQTKRIDTLKSVEEARLLAVAMMFLNIPEDGDLSAVVDGGFELLAGLLGDEIAEFALGEVRRSMTKITSATLLRVLLEECITRWLPDVDF